MIINSNNLNTIADVSSIGISGTILYISSKNYEINKELLKISKDNNNIEILNEIVSLLRDIKRNQEIIIGKEGGNIAESDR